MGIFNKRFLLLQLLKIEEMAFKVAVFVALFVIITGLQRTTCKTLQKVSTHLELRAKFVNAYALCTRLRGKKVVQITRPILKRSKHFEPHPERQLNYKFSSL